MLLHHVTISLFLSLSLHILSEIINGDLHDVERQIKPKNKQLVNVVIVYSFKGVRPRLQFVITVQGLTGKNIHLNDIFHFPYLTEFIVLSKNHFIGGKKK